MANPIKIARIAIDVPLDTYFDYVAEHVSAEDIGRRALVPFGNRTLTGVIVEIAHDSETPRHKLKVLKEILHDAPRLPKEILKLARFCSQYYHHPLGQVLALLLPQRLHRAQAARDMAEPR